MENSESKRQTDQKIEAFTRQARAISIPDTLRKSNEAAIQAALNGIEASPRPALPWWRRRVSVPLPVAAAILLIIALQVGLFLVVRTPDSGTTPTTPLAPPTGQSITEAPPQYAQTCVYVSGMGVVEKNQEFFYQENRL